MNCRAIEELLDDYVDDELKPGLREEVERHLSECAGCRKTLDELRDLLRRAGALPRGLAPSADLLPGIRRAAGDRSARTARPATAATQPGMRWAALAAAVVLLLTTTLVVLRQQARDDGAEGPPATAVVPSPGTIEATLGEFDVAEATYEQAAAELMEIVESRRHELSPQTVAVLDENLEIINRAIEEVRVALEADPADAGTGHALTALHRQKVEILWRVARLSS